MAGLAIRADYEPAELRRLARRAKGRAQALRLLAIAVALEGAARAEAAKAGAMDRQTLRDWVIRFNEAGPEGLIDRPKGHARCRRPEGLDAEATQSEARRRVGLADRRRNRLL